MCVRKEQDVGDTQRKGNHARQERRVSDSGLEQECSV